MAKKKLNQFKFYTVLLKCTLVTLIFDNCLSFSKIKAYFVLKKSLQIKKGNIHKWPSTIFDDFRHPYLSCLTIFNLWCVWFFVVILDLPTLKSDVINGRSLSKTSCWVRVLLRKIAHSSAPAILSKKLGPFARTCNPSKWEVDIWDRLEVRRSAMLH